MRILLALGGTVLSAVAFGLAFPLARVRPLGFVCLVPLLLVLRGRSALAGAGLGALWSVLASWSIGDWMPGSVSVYFEQSRAVGYGFFFGITFLTATPFYAAFGAAYPVLTRRFGPRTLPLLAAAAWTAAELGRGRLLTAASPFLSNPWGLLGYTQAGVPVMLQVASLGGIYAVGFALAAANAGMTEALAGVRGARRRALEGLAVGLLPGLVALGFGVAVLARAPAPGLPEDGVRVGVVQANLDLGSRWSSEFYGRNLDEYMSLSLGLLETGKPALLVWPESAFTFVLEEEPAFQRYLARLLVGGDVELVAGGPSQEIDPAGAGPRYHNSVFALAASGEIAGRYDKRTLLPFAEYAPLGRLDFVRRRFERVDFFTAGEPRPPLPSRAGPAGVLICNEAMLPELAGARVREGAAWLVNPSNDSWIAQRSWGELMLELVSLRAVEQRRWLVRASTAGPSAVIDPWGRIQTRSEPLTRAVLEGAVVPRRGLTAYARLGDAFAGACLLATLAGLLAAARRGARGSLVPPGPLC